MKEIKTSSHTPHLKMIARVLHTKHLLTNTRIALTFRHLLTWDEVCMRESRRIHQQRTRNVTWEIRRSNWLCKNITKEIDMRIRQHSKAMPYTYPFDKNIWQTTSTHQKILLCVYLRWKGYTCRYSRNALAIFT